MSGFREPEERRDQMVLYALLLDHAIAGNHPVRTLESILSSKPFAEAFQEMSEDYNLTEGKPPFHPKYLAALWIYGMLNRLRSSRQLEGACHNRIDFRWLMEGQTPDHSTICGFVKRHQTRLKNLLKATLHVAVEANVLRVRHVAVDGSKVEASAGKGSMFERATLEKKLAEVEKEVEETIREWDENEKKEAGQPEALCTPPKFESPEKAKAALEKEKVNLRAAIDAFDRRKKEHAESGARNGPTPAASTTDPDARLMKDKEGRSKPNYTTQVGVEPDSGLITAEDVTDAPWDGGGLVPMIEQTEQNTGTKPEVVSADSAYNTGPALLKLEQENVTAYMPDSGESRPSSQERNAAIEAAQAGSGMTAEQIALVTERRTNRLGRDAFKYDASRNLYICPNGSELRRLRTHPDVNVCGISSRTQYRSDPMICAGCPLRGACLTKRTASRMITRDQYEVHRATLRKRMATPEGRREYAKRTVTERTHAWLKTVVGMRKFLRRKFDGVRAEFTMACTALNMRILMQRLGQLAVAGANEG